VSKSAKKRTLAATSAIAARTSAQQSQNERKPKQGASQPSNRMSLQCFDRRRVPRIDAMMKATGWQQHSVRGFLAGVVRKRLNLKLSSETVDGNRIYQIKSSDGGKPNTRAARRRPG